MYNADSRHSRRSSAPSVTLNGSSPRSPSFPAPAMDKMAPALATLDEMAPSVHSSSATHEEGPPDSPSRRSTAPPASVSLTSLSSTSGTTTNSVIMKSFGRFRRRHSTHAHLRQSASEQDVTFAPLQQQQQPYYTEPAPVHQYEGSSPPRRFSPSFTPPNGHSRSQTPTPGYTDTGVNTGPLPAQPPPPRKEPSAAPALAAAESARQIAEEQVAALEAEGRLAVGRISQLEGEVTQLLDRLGREHRESQTLSSLTGSAVQLGALAAAEAKVTESEGRLAALAEQLAAAESSGRAAEARAVQLETALLKAEDRARTAEVALALTSSELAKARATVLETKRERDAGAERGRRAEAELAARLDASQTLLSNLRAHSSDEAKSVQETLAQRCEEASALGARLAAAEEQLAQQDGEASGLRARLAAAEEGLAQREGQASDLGTRLSAADGKLAQRTDEVTDLVSRLTMADRRLARRGDELDELSMQLSAAEEKLAVTRSQLDTRDSEVRSLKAAVTSKDAKIGDLNERLVGRYDELDALQRTLADAGTSLATLKVRREEEVAELRITLDARSAEAAALQAQLATKDALVAQLGARVASQAAAHADEVAALCARADKAETRADGITDIRAELGGAMLHRAAADAHTQSQIEALAARLVAQERADERRLDTILASVAATVEAMVAVPLRSLQDRETALEARLKAFEQGDAALEARLRTLEEHGNSAFPRMLNLAKPPALGSETSHRSVLKDIKSPILSLFDIPESRMGASVYSDRCESTYQPLVP